MWRMGGGISELFAVRKISQGVGVERTFPIHSPRVAKIEVVRQGKVRRARLYYLRERSGRAARIKTPSFIDTGEWCFTPFLIVKYPIHFGGIVKMADLRFEIYGSISDCGCFGLIHHYIYCPILLVKELPWNHRLNGQRLMVGKFHTESASQSV